MQNPAEDQSSSSIVVLVTQSVWWINWQTMFDQTTDNETQNEVIGPFQDEKEE